MTRRRPPGRLARPVAALALAATFAASLGGLAAAGGQHGLPAADAGGPVAGLEQGDAQRIAQERCAEPRRERA